jgi:hypothetical protein
MSDTPQDGTTVWDRLRANQERNAPVFLKAGLRPELAREVECESCGAEEMANFWTLVRQKRGTLHLRCPVCERGPARYDLRGDRSSRHRKLVAMFGAAAVLLVIATVLLVRESDGSNAVPARASALVISGYDAGADRLGAAAIAVWRRLPANVRGAWTLPRREARPRTGSAASPAAPARGAGGTRGNGSTTASRSPGATSTTRAGASAPQQPASTAAPAADAGTAAPRVELAAGVQIYAARGDRRVELERERQRIIQQSGADEARLLLQVVYDAQLDETRASVDVRSAQWPPRLSILRGWRRVQP